MAETILQESDQIRPGDRITVFFQRWQFGTTTIESETVRAFAGTIFPVDNVTWNLWGTIAFTGIAHGQQGLSTTLPGRNITAAEFRDFVNSRLSLMSSAWGDVAVDKIVAGDQTASNTTIPTFSLSSSIWLYVGVGLLALLVTAYLLSSVGKVAAVVKR